jgi:hypothetical protein
MPSRPVIASEDLTDAYARFSSAIHEWIAACIERYADAPPTAVHDQATYTTAWEPWLSATHDEAVVTFLVRLRDQLRDHYVATDLWHHGYWQQQEVHHGTEHFELFLGALSRLVPDESETFAQLRDAAEHCGNWNTDVPPWFDWETGLFRSTHLGTVAVGQSPGAALNIPDHLRCVNLCLLAHRDERDTQFLDLAVRHAGRWADAINAGPSLPLGLTARGALYSLSAAETDYYRSFVGQALSDPALAVERAENFLASDALNTFLALWRLTGQERFRRATEKLLDTLIEHIGDPDAGALAAAVRSYRRATGDRRYDRAVLAAVAPLDPTGWQMLTLESTSQSSDATAQRPVGVGKRADMLHWYEDDRPRRHNPPLLALAAELTDDRALAMRSLDIARTAFELARETLPDGRDHGCSSRSVSAVARGNGRENHAGLVTAVFAPLGAHFVYPVQRAVAERSRA